MKNEHNRWASALSIKNELQQFSIYRTYSTHPLKISWIKGNNPHELFEQALWLAQSHDLCVRVGTWTQISTGQRIHYIAVDQNLLSIYKACTGEERCRLEFFHVQFNYGSRKQHDEVHKTCPFGGLLMFYNLLPDFWIIRWYASFILPMNLLLITPVY